MPISSLPTAPNTTAATNTTTLTTDYVEVEALRYLNGSAADNASHLLGLLEGV